MKNHNIYFLFSILSLVLIAPFGAINPLIALAAVGIAGVFFFIWYLKEMEEQEKEYKKGLTNNQPNAIMIIVNEREVNTMNEELLKELLNRIELCQNNETKTYDCAECPLYKTFGDGQNICLKLSEINE